MAQPRPWLDEIIDTIIELGGSGNYDDIYGKILERNIMDFEENENWTSAVRQTIQRYSSDSSVYEGKKDIFFSLYGLGKGVWGLRDFKATEKNMDCTEDDVGFPEGKKKLRIHVSRERNPQVIKKSKEIFKNKHGELFCEICGFNFVKTYGDIGEDFIEGHHIKPVSELRDGDTTKVEDIVLVCSNCHRMLHRRRPWLSKEDLKELLEQNE